MANILFYVPFDQRSRDNESLMIAFSKSDHHVICLNQMEGNDIHAVLEKNGIRTFSHVVEGQVNGFWYLMRHLIFFLRFCRKHQIDIVISHLEPANFVASIGQYFNGSRTFLCRHHIDEGRLYRFDRNIFYYLTYRLARNIVAVSERAKQYLIDIEKIPAKKVTHINLGYDFSLYREPNPEEVREIKSRFSADILLITVCRLTSFKRPALAIEVVSRLVREGFNAKLILLGDGELREALSESIVTSGLQERIFMPGHVKNVLDYLAASDFLIHPSLLDSSSVAIKEAGLMRLPPMVCKGIGDFDDLVKSGVNGFLVEPDEFVDQSVAIIRQYYLEPTVRGQMGDNLRKSILENFEIGVVSKKWLELLEL